MISFLCFTYATKYQKSVSKVINSYIKKANNKAFTYMYSKTGVKWLLSKRPKIGFQDQLSLNAGQKYYRMLQGEHSAILLTFIKLPIVIKIFVLPIFEWPFYCTSSLAFTKANHSHWCQWKGKSGSMFGVVAHAHAKVIYVFNPSRCDL